MITIKGVFFGLAILFTLLTLFFGMWLIAGTIIIATEKKGNIKANIIYVYIILASIFWALALS